MYLLLYLNVINLNLLIIQLKLLDMVLGNMIYGLVVVNVAGTVIVFSWLQRPWFLNKWMNATMKRTFGDLITNILHVCDSVGRQHSLCALSFYDGMCSKIWLSPRWCTFHSKNNMIYQLHGPKETHVLKLNLSWVNMFLILCNHGISTTLIIFRRRI